jgi:hypothetical protein
MAANERAGGRAGRGRGAGAQGKQGTEEGGSQVAATPSGVRVMAAFRIPKPLHSAMTQESRAEGLDLTGYVNRLFDGFLHHFGLPSVVRENLERDREALGFTRYEYLQYLLFRRHEAVAQQGEAFDRGPAKGK